MYPRRVVFLEPFSPVQPKSSSKAMVPGTYLEYAVSTKKKIREEEEEERERRVKHIIIFFLLDRRS